MEAFASSFASIPGPHRILLGPSLSQIGNKSGYYIHMESRYPGATIQQRFYVTENDTRYVVLTASVMDEADLAPMQQAIASLLVGTNTASPLTGKITVITATLLEFTLTQSVHVAL